jgi:hypothetical protein
MATQRETQPSTADVQETEVAESQIAVHWREEEYVQPPKSLRAQANANDRALEHHPRHE